MSEPKRQGQTRGIAALLPKEVKAAFRAHGFMQDELITRWAEIAGPLASAAIPEKLSFRRGERMDGTLHVACESAYATELQHHIPRLIERINMFAGYRAVAQICLIQRPGLQKKAKRKVVKVPDAARGESQFRALLKGKLDPEVENALRRLAIRVLG